MIIAALPLNLASRRRFDGGIIHAFCTFQETDGEGFVGGAQSDARRLRGGGGVNSTPAPPTPAPTPTPNPTPTPMPTPPPTPPPPTTHHTLLGKPPVMHT